MANTTDIMVVCFDEDDKIFGLSNRSGVQLNKVSNSELGGGPKHSSVGSYGACYRSLGRKKINELIHEFKTTEFSFPELAVLIIDDDDQNFNGVVTRI